MWSLTVSGPDAKASQLPGLDWPHRNSLSGQAEERHREPLSHALPTPQAEDPGLAFIVGMWDRLADECRLALIEAVRVNLPVLSDVYEFHERHERAARSSLHGPISPWRSARTSG